SGCCQARGARAKDELVLTRLVPWSPGQAPEQGGDLRWRSPGAGERPEERGVGLLHPLDRVECERYPRIGDAQPLSAGVVTVGLALDEGLSLELAKDLGGHLHVG